VYFSGSGGGVTRRCFGGKGSQGTLLRGVSSRLVAFLGILCSGLACFFDSVDLYRTRNLPPRLVYILLFYSRLKVPIPDK
jgi:hypothetical protein